MHLKRWMTGMLAVPVLILLIGFGPRWSFFLLLCVVSAAGMIEFYRLAVPGVHGAYRWTGVFLSLWAFFMIYCGNVYALIAVISLWAFIPLTGLMLTHHSSAGRSPEEMAMILLGAVYVCLPLGMILMMGRYPQGSLWIFFLLAVVFAGDTGAFYSGMLFGKHKLYRAVSPGKTWEGAIGGLVSSLIVAFWFLRIFRIHPVDPAVMGMTAALSVSAQIGDLVESMLKRHHGVKDSSRILPGHGGILDRIDGLLFATPVLFLFLGYRMA